MSKKRKQQYEAEYGETLSNEKGSKSKNTIHRSGFAFSRKTAMQQHKELVYSYLHYYGGKLEDLKPDKSNYKTELDIVHENNKFIWDDNLDDTERTWNEKVAKNYWDRLNKEYCIADLSKYKEKKYAFRWRTEDEVIKGTGQFTCGNKSCKDHNIEDIDGLTSFEVCFNYKEQKEKKTALVKVKVCELCEGKLNYSYQHKQVSKSRKKKKKERKKREKMERKKKHYIFKEEVKFLKDEVKKEVFLIDSDDDSTNKDTSHISIKRQRHESEKSDSSSSISSKSKNSKNVDIWAEKSKESSKGLDEIREDKFNDYLNDLLF